MIGTSIPAYIFIRLCILALRLITPLSIFYVSFSLAEHPTSAGGRFLLTWSIIEAAFWLLIYIPRKRELQHAAQHPPLLAKEERKALFWKLWIKYRIQSTTSADGFWAQGQARCGGRT